MMVAEPVGRQLRAETGHCAPTSGRLAALRGLQWAGGLQCTWAAAANRLPRFTLRLDMSDTLTAPKSLICTPMIIEPHARDRRSCDQTRCSRGSGWQCGQWSTGRSAGRSTAQGHWREHWQRRQEHWQRG